ncbi:hypothetical protein [Actinomadura kijaniata]|uniref:hypothetical protein n=1 Tax=Actinomadura kijaniata TaxID=46161 RepID=UPI0008321C50|nr:hypothetical protein [Actinomadura kijaniata]
MPTIEEELRQTLTEASANAPTGGDRLAEVRQRIRRGNRMRLAGGALAGASALALAGLLAPSTLTGPDADHPTTVNVAAVTSASSGRALPDTYLGMPRVTAQRFSTGGKRTRIDFAPTGPNTAITIQCPTGTIAVAWLNGRLLAYGDCHRRGDTFGWTTISAPDAGALPAGKTVALEIAVLPASTQRTVAIVPDGLPTEKLRKEGHTRKQTITQYLATNPTSQVTWSTAIYSGTCKSTDCTTTKRTK